MTAEIWRRPGLGYVYAQASISTVWHFPDGIEHVRKPVTVDLRDHLDLMPDRPVYCGLQLPAGRYLSAPIDVSPDAGGHSPSDFPLAELSQNDIEDIESAW